MPDVKAVRHLLANSAGLIAVVPATRIAAGPLPQGTALPAIAVTHVSGTTNSLISEQGRAVTARVQVTIMAATYVQQKAVLALVRAAVPRTRGTVNGVAVETILREPDGPDFGDYEANIYMQTQDYIVKYTE